MRKNPVSHTILTVDPIVKFVTFLTSLAFSGTSGGGHVFAAEKLKKKKTKTKNENEKEESLNLTVVMATIAATGEDKRVD